MDKCRAHPMKIADICCKECKIPVFWMYNYFQTQELHIYRLRNNKHKKVSFLSKKIVEYSQILYPWISRSKGTDRNIYENLETIAAEIRCSVFEENENLKQMADFVLSEKLKSLCKMEGKLRQEMDNQHEIMDTYIWHLY